MALWPLDVVDEEENGAHGESIQLLGSC